MWNLDDGYSSVIGIVGVVLLVVFAVSLLIAFTALKDNRKAKIILGSISALGIIAGVALAFYSVLTFNRRTGEYDRLQFGIIVTIATFITLAIIAGYLLHKLNSKKTLSNTAFTIQSLISVFFVLTFSLVLFSALGNTLTTRPITPLAPPYPPPTTPVAPTTPIRGRDMPFYYYYDLRYYYETVLRPQYDLLRSQYNSAMEAIARYNAYPGQLQAFLSSRTIFIGYLLIPILLFISLATVAISRQLKLKPLTYTTKDITIAGALLSLAVVLSFMRIFRMYHGGSVTLASTAAIMLYAYFFGFRKGSIMVAAFLAFQFINTPWIFHPWQAVFDYVIPYAALLFFAALSKGLNDKIFKSKKPILFFVAAAGYVIVRYFSQVLSGVLFFYMNAAPGQTALAYSLIYNTVFLIDAAIALAVTVVLLLNKPFMKYMERAVANSIIMNDEKDEQEYLASKTFDTSMASDTDTL